jgi:MFS family permease
MTSASNRQNASWLPIIVIALVQIQMAFNVSALIISMGAIVEEFDTSPTTIGTALVVYSLAVAAFVMLGAKIGSVLGSRLVFQIAVVIHGVSMAIMALSTSATMMIQAQILAGLAAAAAVPALVVLIAVHYRDQQQAQALGLLGAAQAGAGVMAFLIVGFLGTVIGWRWPFGMLAILAALNLFMSFRLTNVKAQRDVRIDWIGAMLAATAIVLISLGVDNLRSWGMLLARTDAPVDILGLSPAPLLIIIGIIAAQLLFVWLRKRKKEDKSQLFALEILETSEERAATFCLLIIAALGPAINFLLPLYIQIVQGRSSLDTAVAIIPYTMAILVAATFVVRFYHRFPPRQIGRFGFVTVAIGMLGFAAAIDNAWGNPWVIISLIIVGIGEGALLTLMFNVLVSASPRELAGQVGALRGTVNNLATGLGTAIASLLAVGILSMFISASIRDNPNLSPGLINQINIDKVDFVSNDDLDELLDGLTSDPSERAEAKRINEESRLSALRISVQVLAGIALLAIVPAGGLPSVRSGEVPADLRMGEVSRRGSNGRDPTAASALPQARRRNSTKRAKKGTHQ